MILKPIGEKEEFSFVMYKGFFRINKCQEIIIKFTNIFKFHTSNTIRNEIYRLQ